MRTLLRNSMITPDGTHLISRSRHDYVTHVDKNGQEYMVDGGLDYLRRSLNPDAPAKDTSLYTDDAYELLREELTWGTYGQPADYSEMKYVKIKNLAQMHITAILGDGYGSEAYRKMLRDELQWRKDNISKSEYKRLEVQRGSPLEEADKQRKSDNTLTALGERVKYN